MKHFTLKSLRTLGLALAGLLAAGSVGAQVPVTDVAHISTNKFAWIEQQRQLVADELKQAEQIRNQLQQIQTQIQDIREQQVIGQKLQVDMGPRDTNLQKRAEDEFVEERCSSLGGSGLSGLFTGGASGPERVNQARLRQYTACNLLVRLENRRYNFMVDMAKNLHERDRVMRDLQNESYGTGPDERGRLQRNTNSMQGLQAAQIQEMENGQQQLQLYDQQINALKGEMAMAGQMAFSNRRNSLYGQVVQYGTLKLALEGARSRTR